MPRHGVRVYSGLTLAFTDLLPRLSRRSQAKAEGEGSALARCLKISKSLPPSPACVLRFGGGSDLPGDGRRFSRSLGERDGEGERFTDRFCGEL